MSLEMIELGGAELVLDPGGLVYLPAQRMAIVADLHLEKGSAFARRGTMLPPYDSRATLERLERVLARYAPRQVVSLGDGFHDTAGARLITGVAADLLLTLVSRYDWHWIKGNHDHELPSTLPGTAHESLKTAGLWLQHEPKLKELPVLAGHLHPKARLAHRRRTISRPCFVWNESLMILPAFGTFTGGLNVREQAIAQLLPTPRIALLGEDKLFEVNCRHLVDEPGSLDRVHRIA